MKLKTLVNKIKKDEKLEDLIKVQEFIKFITKRNICDNVSSLCIFLDDETKLMKRDIMFQELLTKVFKIMHLTDIELPTFVIESEDDNNGDLDLEVLTELYDTLNEYGIIEFVECKLANDDIDWTIDKIVSQDIETYNSSSRIISDLISNLPSMEDIGNLMTTLPNQLKDIQNLEILKPSNKTPQPKK